MSDYSRRNRGRFSENYDFEWESFDRKTAQNSTISDSDGELLRRRRATSNQASQRRRRQIDEESNINNYEHERRPQTHVSKQSPKRKRKRKKKLTEKQILFRKRLRTTILVVVLVSVVVLSGMFVGMYAAVSPEISELEIENLALNQTSQVYYYDHNGKAKELTKLH